MKPHTFKKIVMIFVIVVGVIFYFWFIVYNEYGIKKYLALKQQFLEKEKNVARRLKEFEKKKIEQELYLSGSFAKEKSAREDLLFGCTNETVYVFNNDQKV